MDAFVPPFVTITSNHEGLVASMGVWLLSSLLCNVQVLLAPGGGVAMISGAEMKFSLYPVMLKRSPQSCL
jgi:hypothetical protein